MPSPVTLSTNDRPRHQRLVRLLRMLELEGSDSLRSQAERLGVSLGQLEGFLAGTPVSDDVARDIEWTMHLPTGWLDGAPSEPPHPQACGAPGVAPVARTIRKAPDADAPENRIRRS